MIEEDYNKERNRPLTKSDFTNVNTKIATLEQNVCGITAKLDEIINTLKGDLDTPGYRARIESLEQEKMIIYMDLENLKLKITNIDLANGPLAVRLIGTLDRLEAKLDEEEKI